MVVMPAVATTASPVLVAVPTPVRQARPGVVLRPVLAVPQLVVLVLATPVAVGLAVAGWTAALVGGRVPSSVADRLVAYLRFETRLVAYLLFLTDAYPPFSGTDLAYPVRLTARPAPLNRLAVAFRLLLAVPVVLTGALVAVGLVPVLLGVTILRAVDGETVSSTWHEVCAAAVRYQARTLGYLLLLTPEYPWGLLGDHGHDRTPPPPALVYPPPHEPSPPSPTEDPYWQIVLGDRAKNAVVLVLVVGIAVVMAANVVTAVSRYRHLRTTESAATSVGAAYAGLASSVVTYESRSRSCSATAVPFLCLDAAARTVSSAFASFVARVSTTAVPSAAVGPRALLVTDGRQAEADFTLIASSSSAVAYQAAVENVDVTDLLLRFDQDYQSLGFVLAPSG